MNGVNRLARKGEKYYWLPTKREKNYRLPTWTDTIDICFQKEEYFVFFGGNHCDIKLWLIRWSNGKNFRFVDTRACLSLLSNTKSQKSYLEDITDLIHFIEIRKRCKTQHFLFRWTSQVFTQIHHKTRVLNEFAERMKIYTNAILLFLNLR